MKFKLTRWYNWLIYSAVNPKLEHQFKIHFKGKLLDIGCGEKPYASMVKPYVEEHIGVDWEETIHDTSSIDLTGTAYQIPAAENSFDSLLCTYVLEHLAEPSRAVAEANRVLKPGGIAIYTVPLFWHLHEEPQDYFRFTRFGLQHLFESNHFEILEIIPVSGFFITAAQITVYWMLQLRKGGRRNPLWWLIPPLTQLVQAFAFLLGKIEHSSRFTCEYIAVVRKPGETKN